MLAGPGRSIRALGAHTDLMSKARRLSIALRIAVLALAGVAVLLVCVVIVGRATYPYGLEWMEGGTFEHAARVARGQPIYTEPALAWTASIYAPLYYYVVGGVIALSEPALAAGRVVSIAAWLGTLLLLARATRGGWRAFGWIAAGAYAATFEQTLGWVDLVRVDSLFVLLLLAGYVRLRSAATLGHEIWSAFFFALAVLTKQSALVAIVPVALWIAWSRSRWRRVAFSVAVAGFLAAAFAALHASSEGWSTFYTIELPRQLRGDTGFRPEFIWVDFFGVIPVWCVLAGGALVTQRNDGGLLRDSVILGSAILAGWASRLDPLSYENCLLPSYAVIAWFAAEGVALLFERRPRLPIFAIGVAAILVQFATSWFDPRAHWPSNADRGAGDALVARIRAIEGPVLVPYHTELGTLAGKQPTAHMSAMSDIMRSSDEALVNRYRLHLAERIQSRHYAAIVTDGRFMLETIRRHYREGGSLFSDPDVFIPVEGHPMRPRLIFLR